MDWYRKSTLSLKQKNISEEIWIRNDKEKELRFPVETYIGKKTDLLKLKKNIVGNIEESLSYFKKTREEVYSHDSPQMVRKCPVCDSSTNNSNEKVVVYGAKYHQCNVCSHIYVINRPNPNAIHNFYLSDVNYAATYTDKNAAESRLNAIAVPWCNWMVSVFEKYYGRKPNKVLDVGSGAGHFVEACRRAGIHADGIELSKSSQKFSKEVWGFDLDGRNYLDAYKEYYGYDVVTFWGLLEHTPNPKELLDVTSKIFQTSDAGMVISKLPRWDSVSAFIQNIRTGQIVRHLDPMGHISCYTDESAAELYFRSDFYPIASWYYGMDIYELFMQLGHQLSDYNVLSETSEIQLELQQKIDEAKLSDGLTIVGVPKEKYKGLNI